ncbi:MAG: trypsin-like peptidase domain-containing protein [Candidatus Bathycorpusculaceae bacterium]
MNGSGEPYTKLSSIILILLFLVGLIAGGIATYYLAYQQIDNLNREVSNLQNRLSKLTGLSNATYQNITVYYNDTVLSQIYEKVKDSVVLVQARTGTEKVQGSGFVYNFSGLMVVITNYHVVHGAIAGSISVTFSNGNGYTAVINGTDPYADLTVLVVYAPEYEFKPLEIVSSSTLKVSDPVIALGNPYGLVGSMTTGVISALGRTITEEYTGGFAIANIIQTSAPINPGNSGGPLLNYDGKVVGITTAIVSDSQGLGFAVPSNTILKEIDALIRTGTYHGHSYLGIEGTDMNYESAQTLEVNVTYGWLISNVRTDGPSHGKLLVNDIIVALNDTRIRNGDDLASYLEENTLPGDILELTVWRKTDNVWAQTLVFVTLGKRPPPTV